MVSLSHSPLWLISSLLLLCHGNSASESESDIQCLLQKSVFIEDAAEEEAELSELFSEEQEEADPVTKSGKNHRKGGHKHAKKPEFAPAFDLYDRNGNRRLTSKELADAAGLSPERSVKYFTMYDANLDGKISRQEFLRYPGATFELIDHDASESLSESELMEALNINKGMARDYLQKSDNDGDGEMNLNEFTLAGLPDSKWPDRKPSVNPYHPSPVFDLFDLDGSGVLESKELADVGNMDHRTLERLIHDYDSNKDGDLSVNEFDQVKDVPFKLLDLDHNGIMTAFELEEAANFKKEAARTYLMTYDKDLDGKISLEEFNKQGLVLEAKSGIRKGGEKAKANRQKRRDAMASARKVGGAVLLKALEVAVAPEVGSVAPSSA